MPARARQREIKAPIPAGRGVSFLPCAVRCVRGRVDHAKGNHHSRNTQQDLPKEQVNDQVRFQ